MKNSILPRLLPFVGLLVIIGTMLSPERAVAAVSSLGTPSFVTAADTIASYTVPAGTNRLLLVTVSHADTTELTAATAVSFGGQPLTQVAIKKDGAAVDSIWGRVLGTSGSATSGAIVVTRHASTFSKVISFLSAQAFQNVDQTTPTSGASTGNNAAMLNSASTLNVPSAAGDLVLDLWDVWKGTALTLSANGGQTVLNNSGSFAFNTATVASYGGFGGYATSTKPGAAGTVSTGWTSNAEAYIHVALNIKQAAGGAPEIAVTETGIGNVADGGSFAFGTTTVGSPLTKTFTVTNSGDAILNLSGLTVPSGFTIAANFASTVPASGGATSFQITMSAGAAGTPSGTLTFVTDDADENPYNFTISGTVTAPAITGTMMFTQDTGLGDGIAQDGEAGSSDIPGITMQVLNITDTAGTNLGLMSWKNNAWLGSGDAGYSALTYDQNAGTKGMAIKSSDGSEFQLNQFLYYNWGETSSTTITVKGYRNTVEVASTTFAGWINTLYMPITVNLDSSFDNVDDVRLYISAGGYQGDQSATNHSINNIVIAPPVAAPAAPEIAVMESAANVPDGGSLSFGTTTVGSPVTKTFTITNSGDATLNLSGLTVPSGFTIAANFASTVPASGGTTSFQITMSAGAAATPSGTLTFVTDDADENPYNFTISGTVNPLPTNVTVNVPAGVGFTLNSVNYTGPQTVPLAQGSYTLSTTTPQSLGAGSQAVFSSWSDAGAISHSITVGASPMTITGNFTTQYKLTTAANPGAVGMVTPSTGTFYDSGTVVNVSATPNLGFVFSSWTGAVASASSAATTVTMDAAKSITANFVLAVTEIVVTGKGQNIANGDAIPDTADDTDFGSAPVQGVSVTHTFTITNSGTANLTLGTVGLSGGGAAHFSVTQPLSTTVVPGSNTKFTVTYDPAALGTHPATVTFTNNDGDESPFTFDIQGTGTGPQTFDVVNHPLANSPFDSGETYIYMPGGGPVAPTVTTPTSVAVTHNSATLGGNVTADGGTAITGRGVVFAKTADDATPTLGEPNVTNATAIGTTGVFTINASSLTGSTQYSFAAYATNGVGTTYTTPVSTFTTLATPNPEIAVEQPAGTDLTSPSAIVDFGTAELATTVVRTFTVKNTGTSDLTLGAITFTGVNAADFTASAPGSNTLPATTGSTTFTVSFVPLGAGGRGAVMHIASDDANENPFDINLTGAGASVIGGTLGGGMPVVTTTGPFDCTGVTFETDLGFVPTPGQTYPYIHADGGITGTFNDLPDGGVVAMAIGGVIYYFQVDYTGTDVTLTNFTPSGPPAWKWTAGPKARNAVGIYGTKGTGADANNPGARQGAMNWRAQDGSLWMFGGYGYAQSVTNPPRYMNDLWQYDRENGQWIWQSGANVHNQFGAYGAITVPAAANTPGGRHTGTTWTDTNGDLWLFGGFGIGTTPGLGRLNDLWRYDVGTGEWAWMKGSNVTGAAGVYGPANDPGNTPGARQGATGWATPGFLWLFGGTTDGGNTHHSDLWRYDIGSGNWTVIKGSAATNVNGTYAAGPAATPGARRDATGWVAKDNKLWLFGGSGLAATGATFGDMSDLWSFDPATSNWTHISGPTTQGDAGTYTAPNSPGTPAARSASSGWVTVDGDLWLVGGFKNGSDCYSDVWIYDIGTGVWTWKLGSSGTNVGGSYGTLGEASAANSPGGRFTPSTWVTLNGTLWTFGGGGYDAFGNGGRLSDLWSYGIPNPSGAPWDEGIPAPFPDELIVNANPNTFNATAGTMAYVPISGQLSGTDPDGDKLLFSTASSSTISHGTLTLNASGTWTYTPAMGFTGTTSFQFKANDNYGGESPVRTLIITVSTNPADSDGNGIADAYELATFGQLGIAADGDADLDGQSNYFEFLAGTDPLDANERFATAPSVAGISGSGGTIKLQLTHVRPGVNYHLETSTDLDAWTRLGTFTFSAAGSAEIEDPTPATGAPRFYRMNLEATPAVVLP